MSFTAWNANLGTTQGRIPPVNFPQDGSFCFVFGFDLPGHFDYLLNGDFAQIAQIADFEGALMVHTKVRMRPPVAALPGGWSWAFQILVDGVAYSSVTLPVTHTRTCFDIAANVSAAPAGVHELAFKLVLLGVGTDAIYLELPGVYLDAITFTNPTQRPLLMNRNAEPSETNVPISSSVYLELTDVGPSGVDNANTAVRVNGVLAYLNGAFQAGFSGSTSTLFSNVRRINIIPASPFLSQQVVPVHVTSQTVGAGHSLDQTYSFTVQDLTAPQLVAAQARDQRVVRLSFNEAMEMLDATASGDALNPANYLITAVDTPAVAVMVTAVVLVSAAAVDLQLDIDMTPGALYVVVVTDAEDISGNAILAPNNTASFEGFQPTWPAERDFNLWEFWPEMNRREDDGTLYAFTACFQEAFNNVLLDVDRLTDELDPTTAREQYVDSMLFDLGNPFITFDLSLVDKRRLIAVLFPIYNQKGTGVGIINAIRFFLGITITIDEYNADGMSLGESELGDDWELGPGTSFARFSFEVTSPEELTAVQRAQLIAVVNYMKPAHTHFVRLNEPFTSEVIDHLELGFSDLGDNWELH